eukprot:scaffold34643_cov62-Phaeocystis_antarctica.AAC.15
MHTRHTRWGGGKSKYPPVRRYRRACTRAAAVHPEERASTPERGRAKTPSRHFPRPWPIRPPPEAAAPRRAPRPTARGTARGRAGRAAARRATAARAPAARATPTQAECKSTGEW